MKYSFNTALWNAATAKSDASGSAVLCVTGDNVAVYRYLSVSDAREAARGFSSMGFKVKPIKVVSSDRTFKL